MTGRGQFGEMKKGSRIINASRRGVADEEALESCRLTGAAWTYSRRSLQTIKTL